MKRAKRHRIRLEGRPAARVEVAALPDILHLPLRSRRFNFTDVAVAEGESVAPGHVLARDPANYSVPLVAPMGGVVRLGEAEGHITLTDVTVLPEEPYEPGDELAHVPQDLGSQGMKRYKLREMGAWQFMEDAHTGALPDPFSTPKAIIVSTLRFEPFLTRGDLLLRKRLVSFTRGLEHLQGLLEYQPIYLVLPDVESPFATKVRETLRGYAFVKLMQVPRHYPCDHFTLLARGLGLARDEAEPVWAVGVAGILGIDRALTASGHSTVRIISVGGPAARSPVHLKVMAGYPLKKILENHAGEAPYRLLNGGALTGETVGPETLGLDAECEGLTLLAEHTDREFLGFMRPGFDRKSYSRTFLSTLRGRFRERLDTALRGEHRPCVACGFCEEVCPAHIMPHLIHKRLYAGELEEVEAARADLCVRCGMCSFVCPSKIDLRQEIIDGQQRIKDELHGEEVST